MVRVVMLALALVVVGFVAWPATASAQVKCRVIDLDFMAAESPNEPAMRFGLQIVAWLETTGGQFVDTVLITQETGTFGLGNRPGRFDFNSGPDWPYGRRITVFPVWAHRHGIEFPLVVFQDGADNNLSHGVDDSSIEQHYCQPLERDDARWDARTCATQVGTDKGTFGTATSKYPPRNDLVRLVQDAPAVEMFDMLNPFDAVSMATPESGVRAEISWSVPTGVAPGDYVLWFEVSREFDHNATYSEAAYPRPTGIAFSSFGEAYRGQPSVVYRVPVTIADVETVSMTSDYAGYGDPDGLDGDVRVPDTTITSDVPGSGALRLALISDGGDLFRVRAVSHPEDDSIPPALPGNATAIEITSTTAKASFIAPGDDDLVGRVKSYEIRYRVGEDITEANFDSSPMLPVTVPISNAGSQQVIELTGLLPATDYSIGIRAFDNCLNVGPLAVTRFTTADRQTGEVDACFIATAAYGSTMANDVEALRGFRDTFLRTTALGELAVTAYYTFGPAVAGVIGESELLRASARGALRPIIQRVRGVIDAR